MKNPELEEFLPAALLAKCVVHLNLCGIPYPEVLQSIDVASAQLIAVLGAELFRVEGASLHFLAGSGYEFAYAGRWDEFVAANNSAARAFVMGSSREDGLVYILTSVARKEYHSLVAGKDRQ